ncbi:MAG: nitrilase [Gemmatimonadetes bacterium]|nr:nitrilase [Gemmatimonadota bacterium]|tara:strand:- start:504 stop:1466 length:963 start_codon:yes stop_codon:yes gene_type:complete
MKDIRIAAAQFEPQDNDVQYNLGRIEALTQQAVDQGTEIVSFHECCIQGYTFLMTLSRNELLDLAEPVPDGPSVKRLIEMSGDFGVPIAAGLVERDGDRMFNTYAVVSPDGFVTKHRKLHAFISDHIDSGDTFTTFELCGCPFGILICYDNNLPENVRITAMMGAEIIFMPHVTCGMESTMPGRGKIDKALWDNRDRDPVALRQEFLGPKGRGWLMRWLPTRVYENGVYGIYTNPIGVDHDTIKNGNAMIMDPFGEILVESSALEDDVVVGLCTADKIDMSSGHRYLRARRPELYQKLVDPLPDDWEAGTNPGWKKDDGA